MLLDRDMHATVKSQHARLHLLMRESTEERREKLYFELELQ